MIKNRTVQLIYQTAFCTLGIVGIIASMGIFDYNFKAEFYVYFTNLSNYFCIGIVFAELIQTIKRQDDDYVKTSPILKFIGMLAILLTFIIYNFILAADKEMRSNFKINSVLLHIVLPIMYLVDWILFYEHKKIKWTYPMIALSFPFVYAVFIFGRAWILNFDPTAPHIYPYFFLNLDKLGVLGVMKWLGIIFVLFATLGYGVYGLDRLLVFIKNKIKKDEE